MDAVALLGGNEYLVQQLLDRLLDAGFTTAQVIIVVMVVMVMVIMVIMVMVTMNLVKASISFSSCWIGSLIRDLQRRR